MPDCTVSALDSQSSKLNMVLLVALQSAPADTMSAYKEVSWAMELAVFAAQAASVTICEVFVYSSFTSALMRGSCSVAPDQEVFSTPCSHSRASCATSFTSVAKEEFSWCSSRMFAMLVMTSPAWPMAKPCIVSRAFCSFSAALPKFLMLGSFSTALVLFTSSMNLGVMRSMTPTASEVAPTSLEKSSLKEVRKALATSTTRRLFSASISSVIFTMGCWTSASKSKSHLFRDSCSAFRAQVCESRQSSSTARPTSSTEAANSWRSSATPQSFARKAIGMKALGAKESQPA
mmetsp:Transcript_106273/g.253712  ORF Transcript_106273/g.253712 Transcript_106273/m.253712 type:complete len:290 (-) Transcript_106273:2-871(-)